MPLDFIKYYVVTHSFNFIEKLIVLTCSAIREEAASIIYYIVFTIFTYTTLEDNFLTGISCSGRNPTTMVRCEVLINDNSIEIASTEWQNSQGKAVGGNANTVLKSLSPRYCFVRLADKTASESNTRSLTSNYN